MPLLAALEAALLVLAYLVYVFSALPLTCHLKRVKPTRSSATHIDQLPGVDVVVASYNEGGLVSRSLLSLLEQTYPRGLLRVLVLDDSTDPSSKCAVEESVEKLKAAGMRVDLLRRSEKIRGKPGFLKQAEPLLRGPLVFLLDSDFKLKPDAIEQGVEALLKSEKAYVQLGWGLEGKGLAARVQRALLAYHVSVEQPLAVACGLPVKINGSLCLLRLEALRSVGGWDPMALTEDLDLTIRLYMSGCEGDFCSKEEGVGLVASSFRALYTQAGRWTAGDIQALKKYGTRVLRKGGFPKGFQAFAYLFDYAFAMFSPLYLASISLSAAVGGSPLILDVFLMLPLLGLLSGLAGKDFLLAYVSSFAYELLESWLLIRGIARNASEMEFVRTEKVKKGGFSAQPWVIFVYSAVLMTVLLYRGAFLMLAPALLYALSALVVAVDW